MNTIHIFDVDVTIADNSHRVGLLNRTCVSCLGKMPVVDYRYCLTCCRETESVTDPGSLELFHTPELILKDEPVAKALEYANVLRKHGAPVHFLTGRLETSREATTLWLKKKFNLQPGETLTMRSLDEERIKTYQYKDNAFQRVFKSQHKDTLFIFYEDEMSNLAMFKKHGLAFKCPEAWAHLVPDNHREPKQLLL